MRSRVIFTSLRMENFGCFRDRTVTFAPGLNQMVGHNESGKSTIIKALHTVLFEDGPTSKKAVASVKRWSAEAPFRLTLIFSVGDKQFTLIRDYGLGRDIMTDSDEITYEGKSIREKLNRYFGTDNRRLFEAVFCFASDTPEALDEQRSRLRAALETPVLSGFNRVHADAYLEEQIKALDNPRSHGPRELDRLGEWLEECLHRREECEQQRETLDKSEKDRCHAEEEVSRYEEEITRLERLIAGAEAYQQLDQRMANLEERLQTHLTGYSKAVQTAETLEKLEKELHHLNLPPAEDLAKLNSRRDELIATAENAKSCMDDLIQKRNKSGRAFWGTTLLLALSCLTFVLESNGMLTVNSLADGMAPFVWILALIWVIGLGLYLYQIKRKKTATTLFRRVNARLNSFYADLNAIYDLKSADPLKVLYEADNRRQALELTIENLQNTLALLSDNNGLPGLVATKEQFETEVALVNKDLAVLTIFAAYAGRLPSLKEELTASRVRRNAFAEQAALLRERCSARERLIKELEDIDAQIETAKRQHRESTEKLEVYHITRLALNRAADLLIEQTIHAFNRDASRYLAFLTDNRYQRLRISGETDHFELEISDTGQWHQVGDFLSSSTRDAVYLALRMAAVTHITGDFPAPVIFDQADVRMDDVRRDRYIQLLVRLAEEHQVIYGTTRSAFSADAAHRIELGVGEEVTAS